ncbi:unnamed protein product [marine sediment metagenome]|uniref:Uncharacterized protein n=1 Tax=marine sediment metagenome TaxID=412755 RepID=X0ZKF4_9ZZZZ
MSGEGVCNPLDETQLLANIATLQAAVDDLDADVVLLQADVDAIEALVAAEGILEETGGELTTDGNEQNVYINNAPAGVYVPTWFNLNFTNHTATETVVIRTYYRTAPGGAWVRDDNEPVVGIPVNLLVWVKLKEARYGIRVTIEKTVGTNRAYVWQVFYEV